MKDGTILLYRVTKNDGFGPKLIAFFTGMPYHHAAIYCMGSTYEEGPKGASRTDGLKRADEYWEPVEDMTPEEKNRMWAFLWWTAEFKHGGRWPYNFLKFVVLALVYPTKKFWNKIGWMPFQNDLLGEVCSTYVDYAWRAAGRDILMGWGEEFTVPGDLAGLPGFKLVVRYNRT